MSNSGITREGYLKLGANFQMLDDIYMLKEFECVWVCVYVYIEREGC